VVTSYVERAAMRKNPPRRDRADGIGRRVRLPEACRAWCASSRIVPRCAFFKRVAVALEREARSLKRLAERFDATWQRLAKNVLHALGNLGKGQRFGTGHFSAVANIASESARGRPPL
jgi:hypothetical protein